MDEFAKYLPLSQHQTADETGVTNNWSRHLGMILLRVAEVLEACGDASLSAPSMQEGRTVREVARELVRTSGGRMSRRGSTAEVGDEELAPRLRELAVLRMSGRPRASVRELGRVMIGAYDIAHGLHQPLVIDPVATGAVALARALTAPTPIKAVIRGRTLHATDAGWRVGHGPELPGTAAAIVLFLYGRGGVPSSGASATGD